MKTIKLNPGARVDSEVIEIEGALGEWQEHVGGYIEVVPIVLDCIGIINEEGKIHGLERNSFATAITRGLLPGDYIAGSMVIVREKDGEFVSLTDSDIEVFQILFEEANRLYDELIPSV